MKRQKTFKKKPSIPKLKLKKAKTITLKDVEKGVWQFVLDHAVVRGENLYEVKFGCSSKDQLMKRIYARATGVYKIKNEGKLKEQKEKSIKHINKLITKKKELGQRESKIYRLPKWKRWMIKTLRRLTKKLIKIWT